MLSLLSRHVAITPRMSLARMSMWSTKFEEPLTSKQEIDSIRNTPEYDRKVNVPIKAALKTASCSMFKDPILTRFINMVQEHSNGMKGETILLETCRRIKEIQLEKFYKANPEKRDDIERVIEEKLEAVGIKAEKIESVQEKEGKVKKAVKLKTYWQKEIDAAKYPMFKPPI